MSMDIRKFLKKFNMRNIYKNITIALILMLLEPAACSRTVYALRPPSHFSKATEKFISQQSIQSTTGKPDLGTLPLSVWYTLYDIDH